MRVFLVARVKVDMSAGEKITGSESVKELLSGILTLVPLLHLRGPIGGG